jgi:hypothetical protein
MQEAPRQESLYSKLFNLFQLDSYLEPRCTQNAKPERQGNCPVFIALPTAVLGCMEYTQKLIVHGDRDAIEQRTKNLIRYISSK